MELWHSLHTKRLLLSTLTLVALACSKHSPPAPLERDGGTPAALDGLSLRVADQSGLNRARSRAKRHWRAQPKYAELTKLSPEVARDMFQHFAPVYVAMDQRVEKRCSKNLPMLSSRREYSASASPCTTFSTTASTSCFRT